METILQTVGISESALGKVKDLWRSGSIRLDLPVIDLQHIWLVALIQELSLETDGTRSPDAEKLKKLLLEISDFATEHFSLEEDLTTRFRYPEHPGHREQHKHFIEVLNGKIADVKNGQTASINALVNFLLDWLTMHIQKEDKNYRDFLVRSNANLREYFQKLVNAREITIDRGQVALYNMVEGKSEVGEILNESILSNIIKIWNTHNLAVQIPIIDLQHIWLISMVVELDIASKTLGNTKRQKIFNKVIAGTVEYTREHFATEEKIMERFAYKNTQNHIKQHRSFVEMVHRRQQENETGDARAAAHLVEDLKEWLVSHIAIKDRNIYLGLKDQLSEIQNYVRELINAGELVVKKKQVDMYNQVCGLKKAS